MAITDVRSKINIILAEGKKARKPKDPHKKTRQGAPEATAADCAAVCEDEVFEEVVAAQGLTPMANQLLDILRQKMEQGQFQVLALDIIDQIKAANPDRGAEVDAAFEQLKAQGLITVNDVGISTTPDVETPPLSEFFRKNQKSDFTDKAIVSGVDGRPGMALADDGTEVAVRWDGEEGIQWVPRELVELPGEMETRSYIGPTDKMNDLIHHLQKVKFGRRDIDTTKGKVTQYDVEAPAHFHTDFQRTFNKVTNVHPNKFYRETVELTDVGIRMVIENLIVRKK